MRPGEAPFPGGNDLKREGVLDFLLGQAAQVARAELEGIPLLHQVIGQRTVPGQADAALGQAVAQVAQQDARNLGKILFGQLVKGNNFINPIEELRPHELFQRPHGLIPRLLGDILAEAERRGGSVRTGVGGHHNDGIFKVDLPSVRVRNPPVVQNLEQGIEHIGMCLFNLVQQNHGVGAATDFLGQLPRLIVADIAGGRPQQAGNGVLLHIFRHIEPDQRLGRVKQVVCKGFDQLGLADAGRADEQEGHRLFLGADARAGTADRGANRVNRLILPDNARL